MKRRIPLEADQRAELKEGQFWARRETLEGGPLLDPYRTVHHVANPLAGGTEISFTTNEGGKHVRRSCTEEEFWAFVEEHELMLKPPGDGRPPSLVAPQPPPQATDLPAVWDLVVADMRARDAEGARKYGVRLQPGNGRDALVDAYQEALDLCAYLRQAIYERDRVHNAEEESRCR